MRFEWRNRGDGNDALIAVDNDSNTVREAWKATGPLLEDFLNEMGGLDGGKHGTQMDVEELDPQQWGGLVISRSDSGDVLYIDPELYWDRLSFWFRARGEDPHPWRGRR